MSATNGILARALATRRATDALAAPLSDEDCLGQSMPDASPTKWHLAHTTWFFERFVLRSLGIAPVAAEYDYLWNSYYDTVGARHPRAKRGLLTRPSLAEVRAYRAAVDTRLAELEGSSRLPDVAAAIELGMRHEEQHQELILTDVKHLFAQSALLPAYTSTPRITMPDAGAAVAPLRFVRFEAGVRSIGAARAPAGDVDVPFSFDHERPRHRVHAEAFEVGNRLVTCAEYEAFVADAGYHRPELWLSEGFAWLARGEDGSPRERPAYWLDDERVFSLHGARHRDPGEPVCHLSYYEADAYARWAGARLPTEAEWEIAAEAATSQRAPGGAFAEDGTFHPTRAGRARRDATPDDADGPRQLAQVLGDAWEWTSSALAPYPGFRPLDGAFAEYNGKFMVGQYVLRGGSALTPRGHTQTWTRNFFPPATTFQMSGLRLARSPA